MRSLALAAALLLLGLPAAAQPLVPPCNPNPTTYQDLWCGRVQEILNARQPGPTGPRAGFRADIENAVEISSRNWRAFVLYAQARSEGMELRPIEDARIDKQLGAPAGAGSTSVVSKGAAPAVFAVAVENGALTQSTTATTMTFRGNLVGWLDLVRNQGFIASYEDDSPFVRGLRRVSYSLTLNTDPGASTSATPAPSGVAAITPAAIRAQLDTAKRQLAGYSVRVGILDQRDPRTAANRAAVATLLDTAGVDLLKSDAAFDAFLASPEYNRKWFTETVDQLSDTSRALSATDIQRILYRRLEVVRLLMVNRIEHFNDQIAKALHALQAYDKARTRTFEAMQKRPLVAFEYVGTRTQTLPQQSIARVIAEGQWGPRVDLTANVSATFQHAGTVALPQLRSIGGLRDFQAAAQLEVPLASAAQRVTSGTGIGAPVFAIAYLSQRLMDRAAVTFSGNTFTVDPGWIHALQGRLLLQVKGSGVKIPLSITYANRTELLKEKNVRGHIGVTFDMDVLSSLVRR
jgi:hypothetical protein